MATRWDWKSFRFVRATDDGARSVTSSSLGFGFEGNDSDHAYRSSIVMSAGRWAMRQIVEPPLGVFRDDALLPENPLTRFLMDPQGMLDQPNRDTIERILQGVVLSLGILDGNAYLHILRAESGRAVGLEYVPHTAIQPVAKAGYPNVLDYYRMGGQKIEAADIIHFKEGYDPENPLLGLSPLKSLLRQVMSDNQASIYSHAILRNMGVPSHQIGPKPGEPAMDAKVLTELAEHWTKATTGEKRGGVFATAMPVDISKIGFSPEELALDRLIRVPEERICAVMLIPPIVLGLGAGLEHATMANYREALRAATENFLVPMWQIIGNALEQLALEPGLRLSSGDKVRFDLRDVKALQEDTDAKFARAKAGYDSGFLTREDARAIVGLEATPADRVYKTDILAAMRGPTPAQKAAERRQVG